MRHLYNLLILCVIAVNVNAQVSISVKTDTTSADPSAMLDIKSSTKGVLLPRVALTSLTSSSPVQNPSIGLLVFNTATAGTPPANVTVGLYQWGGTQWIPVSAGRGTNSGDMLFWNKYQWIKVPVGRPGQFLQLSNDSIPTWTDTPYPSILTLSISSVTDSAAFTGGNVTSDGGSPVAFRGVCWNTGGFPTISDNKTINGSGTGEFISHITGLIPGYTYHLRAYATNNVGTKYGNEITFTTTSAFSVTTDSVTSITYNSAISGGIVLSGGVAILMKGICWSLNPLPTINDNKSTNGTGEGSFSAAMPALLSDTVYYVRAYATTSSGITYGNQKSFRTLAVPPSPCPDIPTVVYGNKTYNTVLIGSQCWLKENLDIGTRINGAFNQMDNNIIEKYCFNDQDSNCTKFGGLYQWNEVNNYINLAGSQGICPSGWHLPGYDEMITLINYNGGTSSAGSKLKEGGTIHWASPNIATNKTGFTALPGSYRTISGVFGVTGTEADFWSSSIKPSGFTSMMLTNSAAVANIVFYANNNLGFSARCIKDTCTVSTAATINISPSQNPVCPGNQVSFTATTTNAGNDPFYQWKVNGIKAGTDTAVFTYTPSNNDVVSCILYSSYPCAVNPTFSSQVTMSVPSVVPVSVTVTASANPVCAGSTSTFTANPVNGGSSPLYQWKKGGVNITGATNVSYTYTPVQGDAISCAMTSSLQCTSGNPATSPAVSVTVNAVQPVSLTIAASSNNICSGTQVTFIASPTNGGTTPAYQWKKGGVVITGATNSTYTYSPVNGDVITCVLTSNVTCPTGSPATSNAVTMTVNPMVTPSVTISASATSVCSGTSVTFTATPTNGGTTPLYQWKKGGTSITGATNITYSYIPANGDVISCQLTSNATCTTSSTASSNQVTMTVSNTSTVSVSITASANNICSGTSVTFTALPTNGGSSPAYQWQKGGVNITGATSSTYSVAPANNDVITCILTSNVSCPSGNPATSNAITMQVNTVLPVSISIAASSVNVCTGTSVTFTATPTNGGTTPSYQWKIGGTNINGATNSTYVYTPSNGDVITCQLTSSASCTSGNPAVSNSVTMTVNPVLAASVSISASASNVCSGTTVTFTATPTNGGTTPSYQWKKGTTAISGATNATYSYSPANGDQISCQLTSSLSCTTGNPASSNTITMTVTTNMMVYVNISASSNPVCSGATVIFTATPTNGGPTPAYQWDKGGVAITGATNSTYSYAPANGDVISCDLSSSLSCPLGNPATSNAITMTVNSLQPVNVAIAASANPVCNGTSVTFTATPTNGGSSPAYQWKSGSSNISGATNSTYSYAPSNGDVITCVLTSNISCPGGNPATSNAVTMTVNPVMPVSISIATSANPFCPGSSVTLTATPTNGGTTPAYQWYKGGSSVSGATLSTYAYTPANGDVITCKLTSNINCPSGNPATSNAITLSQSTVLPVSVSISTSSTTVCNGTTCTFTATPTNGGSTPVYQWKKGGTNISGATNATYSYVPANGDIISCQLTSSLTCISGNPANSNSLTMTVNATSAVSVSIVTSSYNVCSDSTVTLTATPVNGGTSPVYQWKKGGTSISGATNSAYTYTPSNGDVITCVLTSSILCPTGNPATSNAITLNVHSPGTVSLSITSSLNPVCSGTSVTYTATPTNGGTTPAYQWKKSGSNITGATNSTYNYIPLNGDIITCQLVSNATCVVSNTATSNSISQVVNPPSPVSVSINPSANSVCAGTTIIITASPTNGGTSPAYQWLKGGNPISGATGSTYSYIPVNGDVITCQMTSNATCITGNPANSSPLTITINPLNPVSVTISASANNVCAGTAVKFTATPTNGGTSPGYQWLTGTTAISGATDSTYTFAPSNGEVISCLLYSGLSCPSPTPAHSNELSMTILPLLPVSVSVVASDNNICTGTSVTFTATATNGGSSPLYQWRLGSSDITGATNQTYSYIPANGDNISCKITSNASCITGNQAVSNIVTMNVSNPQTVSVSITASSNSICEGSSVTFTASPTNGGNSPQYQWYRNSTTISGATGSTYTYLPVQGDVISCTLVSNAGCISGNPATSNQITMTVLALTNVNLTISATSMSVCAGTSVTFSASPTNGGTAPTYQWIKGTLNISGATNPTYSYIPANGDAISCLLTSNATCPSPNPAVSNTITMTVTEVLPVSVAISASSNPSCSGSSVTFSATPTNGGSTPVYQWKINNSAVSGATNAVYTYIPSNNETVSCILTSSLTCKSGSPATSNTVTMTVNSLQTVSVSAAASANPVCSGSTVTFTATPANGGTSPLYQWYVNEASVTGATNSTYSFAPSNGNTVKCQMVSSVTCPNPNPAVSNTVSMSVLASNNVSISVVPSSYAVVSGTTVLYTANPVNGGSNPGYTWKKNGSAISGATASTYSYVPLNNDNISCTMTSTMAGCLTNNPATSNTVNMIVYTTGMACNPATVVYGGMTYNTDSIGTQCWLRENLNIGTMIDGNSQQTNNGIPEKYCYLNVEANCSMYGGLYQWGEVVQYYNNASNNTNWNPAPTGNVQGLCPSGWHVPTNSEITTLMNYVGGITVAGGKLKETGTVHWLSPNTGAGNAYGFTAMPHGMNYNGTYSNRYQYGHHWIASLGSVTYSSYVFGFSYNLSSRTWAESERLTGYAVRCMKN